MFETVSNKLKQKKMIRLLGVLVAALTEVPAGASAPLGYALLPQKDAAELVAAEPSFVSVNPTVAPDAKGMVQVAVLQAGVDALKALAADPGPSPVAVEDNSVTATFEIRNDVPLPSIQRGGGTRVSKYPFDRLDINGSFFVEGTTSKTFASTINTQNKKYSTSNPVRKFTVRSVTEGGKAGIRVWRITPKA